MDKQTLSIMLDSIESAIKMMADFFNIKIEEE